MKMQKVSSLSVAGLLFTVACGANGDGAQGPKRNGLHVNGLTSNGLHVNGLHLNGLSANGLSANGAALEGVYVTGSELSALTPTGEILSGAALVGATFEIAIQEAGVEVPALLRIDGVELDAGAVTPDVHLHAMSYRRQGEPAWQPVCTDDSGAPEPAIPIGDLRWDPATGQRDDAPGFVTLACKSGAIGSCASWGYRPWIPALLDHHQACIYMKRADYCGDGTAYTVNGTMIDVYDHLSPPLQTQATGWPLEAHWGPEGARCVSSRRHPEIPFSGQCLRDGVRVTLPACGEAASAGDLLTNRAHPGQAR
jgi:hypothetical protein